MASCFPARKGICGLFSATLTPVVKLPKVVPINHKAKDKTIKVKQAIPIRFIISIPS